MDEKRTILFVTSNSGKLNEAKLALNPFGFTIKSFNFNEEFPEIEEIQSSELRRVAKHKLRRAVKILENSSNRCGVMVERRKDPMNLYCIVILFIGNKCVG